MLVLLGGLLVLYLLGVLLLFAMQRKFIYPAPRSTSVMAYQAFRDVRLRTEDGITLRALHKPTASDLPTILFFHGNGDNLAGAIKATELLAAAGYGLLLPEYRGYGGNPGMPSEAGLYRDGEAALRWLDQQGVEADRVVLVGNSLGAGVATELATRHTVSGLVLVSGFTSLPDVAASHLRFLPARWLVLDRYENAAKLRQVNAPVLVLHGAEDTLIPAAHGERLAQAAPRGELVIVPDVGHELAYLPQSGAAMLRWLERRTAKPKSIGERLRATTDDDRRS